MWERWFRQVPSQRAKLWYDHSTWWGGCRELWSRGMFDHLPLRAKRSGTIINPRESYNHFSKGGGLAHFPSVGRDSGPSVQFCAAPRFALPAKTTSPILHMNISPRDGPVRHNFHCGPWRRWWKGRTQRRRRGSAMKIETTVTPPHPPLPLTAPLMFLDRAYARKIKAYQNITLIFALCMCKIVYDMLFDIHCTFGRRKTNDVSAKLCNEPNVFVFATSRH